MTFERLTLPEVLLITPTRHGDARGWLMEAYSQRAMAEAGVRDVFVQDNHAYSPAKGQAMPMAGSLQSRPCSHSGA